ncbi:MAG: PEP-CTERM sorting domain-containing protein [Cyanobacteriota bacterium]|nr:PEP-CTERM sorting domain-containing protein [Cyanobacteriota bacterium]
MLQRQNTFANPLCWVTAAFAVATTVATLPAEAIAATISATASGSMTPTIDESGNPLINGDFTITPTASARNNRLGNALDEITTWDFDFTDDPNFSAFPTSEELTSALLTLTLRSSFNVSSDDVKIVGLPEIEDIDFLQGLAPRTVTTFTLDLLDYYSSSDILDAFTSGVAGLIPMEYRDDALISFAQLDLTVDDATGGATVPEPTATLSLLAIGIAGFFSKRQRQDRQA